MKSISPAARAKRRNANAEKRYPLLAHAGLLDQIGVKADWTAKSIEDDEFARSIERDQQRIARDKRNQRMHQELILMLDEAITEENREEVIADYEERVKANSFASASLNEISNRIDYLNRYLALYLKRPVLEIYQEAQRRIGEL